MIVDKDCYGDYPCYFAYNGMCLAEHKYECRKEYKPKQSL